MGQEICLKTGSNVSLFREDVKCKDKSEEGPPWSTAVAMLNKKNYFFGGKVELNWLSCSNQNNSDSN